MSIQRLLGAGLGIIGLGIFVLGIQSLFWVVGVLVMIVGALFIARSGISARKKLEDQRHKETLAAIRENRH